MQLFERLCTTFLHTMPHLFPTAVIIVVKMSSPHCRKGRRYFDAVPRTQRTAKNSFGCFVCFWNIGCSKVFGGYRRWPLHLTNHVHANVP